MTVLTIKEISENVEEIRSKDIEELMLSNEQSEFSANLLTTLTENSNVAKDAITSRLEEKLYANLRSAVANTVLSMMMLNGDGLFLSMANKSGELITFVDSVTMAIIGTLINEEVL